MITLLRIDHRLIHGQVAFSWTGYLGADCILVANDDCVTNELRRATIRLAKPAGVKLVIKGIDDSIAAINSGKTDKYHLFIVVDCVRDAYRLAKEIDQITRVNVGGLKATAQTHPSSADKNINLTDEDESMLRELMEMGKEVELRMVPSNAPKTL